MIDLKKMAFERKNTTALLAAASVLKGVAIILQALFFVWIVDGVFLKGDTFETILPLLAGLLGAVLLRVACGYVLGRTGVHLATTVKSELRKKLIGSFATNPLQAAAQGQSGQKVSLLMDAVDEVDGFFSKYIPQMMQTYTIPLMLLAVIFYQHWVTGVIILITAPFIPVFMAIVGKRTKVKADEKMGQLSQFSGTFLDVLQGLTTLNLFGQAGKQKQLIQKNSMAFRDATMDVLKSAFLSSLMLEYISMLGIGIIALEIGLRLVVFQNITFATAFFMMLLVPDFFNMLKDFGSAFHTARGSMSAANLLSEEFAKEDRKVEWGEERLASGPPHIQLDGLAFQYGEGFALHPVQAEIPPYSQVAIIGKSGSGKTTLMHLIAGLLPASEGTMKINGVPRETVSEKSWFDQLSYISQTPYLFAGTIKENIVIGANRDVTHEEVMEAAKKAGIEELVASLKQGFDTPVGEAGRGLSGGEKQRIALARAFLKKPSIILFDEPTTGLDLQTERILQDSMTELAKTSTVITIAHRLHTISRSDLIFFLSDGRLSAVGGHKDLMENHSPYREMVAVQQGGVTR
ncbi:thiol reductant ABC exporter subunit CydD [Planococcus sp. N028]|uniref:Thiol reductant ABC exporter subunit CydD n=1 Tax=Planococcus shixiaomingii TaxID=3058393 RepID=A0ABT8N5X3_9BACL|nr:MULTISPECIES: thiol reductant ABC exporter subunit CydD [unclassified Planococcus (in: firmicutes)]MDN7243286.1 thiol reductant ABC exporter subunit CydD [Planococcus sp. N028]WKA55228.1 thiol reductant ABC exporter subunit CydD [Planococcus sp. N022]